MSMTEKKTVPKGINPSRGFSRAALFGDIASGGKEPAIIRALPEKQSSLKALFQAPMLPAFGSCTRWKGIWQKRTSARNSQAKTSMAVLAIFSATRAIADPMRNRLKSQTRTICAGIGDGHAGTKTGRKSP